MMATTNPELETRIANFKIRILKDPVQVIDPESQHHQFAGGDHGRKLDFDRIKTKSRFYEEWITLYSDFIDETYEDKPKYLIGIANGANRLAADIGKILGIKSLETEKNINKTIGLTNLAKIAIRQNVGSVLLVEDVGTTGGTTASLVPELRNLGVMAIEVVHTWIRTPHLPKLDDLQIPYQGMIWEKLAIFSPEDCATDPEGFCHNGIPLIAEKPIFLSS